jgi:predicted PhzF superfamily epimerase YddE/YHI9
MPFRIMRLTRPADRKHDGIPEDPATGSANVALTPIWNATPTTFISIP